MITRRRFFGLLGGVTAATLAPPIYVLAPPNGWNASPEGILTFSGLNPVIYYDPSETARFLTWNGFVTATAPLRHYWKQR